MIGLKTTTRLLLLSFLSFGSTLGNTVSMSPSSPKGKVDESLELTCQLSPTAGATAVSVKWYIDGDTNTIELSASTCSQAGSPSNRYSFTCSSNTFKVKILALKSSDNGQCWSCSVTFSSVSETDKALPACITIKEDLYPLLLLLIVPLVIFIILICCGCLDCCKCCRIFDHYDEKKCCYVAWYCPEKGCCSFFCCRRDNERGKCCCCCDNKEEYCGGCSSCFNKCGCGWPDFCKHEDTGSCGFCICDCCVKRMEQH